MDEKGLQMLHHYSGSFERVQFTNKTIAIML